MTRAFLAVVLFFSMTVKAAAQDTFWIQIDGRQTLTDAQERARDYAGRLDGVSGFYLGGGYYGIVIGPFDKPQADAARMRLLGRKDIPSDSFVRNDRFFQQRFWPVGNAAPTPVGDAAPTAVTPPPEPVASPAPVVAPAPATPPSPPVLRDETRQQALASESALSEEERRDLQRALEWAGFYNAGIDGAFGRGTRAAMQAWQTANNVTPTGILTTRQRAMLKADYNSILDGMNMRLVREDASGIQILIPTGAVAFTEYQPPFVRYEASGNIPQAKVLLISQAGDRGKLTGLYEILQILDVVPPDGPRSLSADGFEIEGIGDGIASYSFVTLQDGVIKGFMLVWPEGDEPRRQRMIAEMRSSFERRDGVLDPRIAPPSESQSIDMVSGLAVRQPKLSRTGFYVSGDGVVLTTPEAIAECERITYDHEYDAQVAFTDTDLGIALLRPVQDLVPLGVAEFQTALPRLQDRIAVAGYPFNGALGAPTLTFGKLADLRDLTGDARFSRLAILSQVSDAGGPVLDESGTVLGMLLPRADDTSRTLPPDVHFALDAGQIVAALANQGIQAPRSTASGAITPVALTHRAADVAVLVSCW